ncbi:MAG: CidA/LrgA family protein [Bacillota bacterium]|jgi:holin-like protein
MKIYNQIAILLGICLTADIISAAVPFKFPTNVTAMVILLILLFTGLVKLDWVEKISNVLVNNMQIMFIPSACSLMISYKMVLSQLGSFIFICIISTLITWLVTCYTIVGVTKLQNKIKMKRQVPTND